MSQAEKTAQDALLWIAGDPDLVGRFLGMTGIAPDDLAATVATPDGLAAVMDFILSEDDLVVGLAQHLGQTPEDIVRARTGLPGGVLPNWT